QSSSIQAYREAYKRLGIDPEEYKSSIEYLVTQAARGKGIPMINPIADLASAVSIKYLVPVRIYDIDAVDHRLEVRFSEDGDIFAPYGEEDRKEEVEPGEVVYASGKKVKARKWIWRQSEEGKIKKDTSRLLVSIDGFEGINKESVLAARDEVASYLAESFDATVATEFLNYSHNKITAATGGEGEEKSGH
ncbi:MAG: phenylalanine--tRNA ligase beta subunit-related protein, partial [Spirochaetia bacterium]